MNRPAVPRRSVPIAALGVASVVDVGATASSTPADRHKPAATIHATDGRTVRIWRWDATAPERGVILFSHGALSAPWKYERLLRPWSAAGFRILAPLHVDSTDHPDHATVGMIESWRARLLDMRALSEFAGAPRFVAAGHSYGALVALTLGGADAVIPPGITGPLRNPHAGSVVAFSPPGPAPGLVTPEGYATLAVPAIIQTGTHDVPRGTHDGTWQAHLTAFEEAPAGDKYALVLPGVDHYFGGLICRLDLAGPPQTAQLADAVRLATDFIESFGAADRMASDRIGEAVAMGALIRR